MRRLNLLSILCFIIFAFLSYSFQLRGQSELNVKSRKQLNFDAPQLIYNGYIAGQSVMLNIQQVPKNAQYACFVQQESLGTTPDVAFWILVKTDLDFHYTHGRGYNQNSGFWNS